MGRPVWVSLRSEILASVGASAIKARPVDLIALQANLSKSYPAIPESVTRIRHELVDYARAAGISGEALEGVQLSVSEAVTNVVRHAYRDGPGEIHVTAAVLPDELWILIADDGCGFNTPPADPGMGMGLALITQASSAFSLAERAEGGTEATMRFPLSGS